MQRLCFGGTFNPIHHGHLICARYVAEHNGFDRVTLIPSARPPHKPSTAQLAPPEHRLAMCRLAADEQSNLFDVEDLELNRTGPSFTIDTVRELKSRGWGDIHWLIGADMLLSLPLWHMPESLVAEVNFIVMARPGWKLDWSSLPPLYRRLESHVRPAPLIDISANSIRQRLAAGESIAYLAPRSVIEYIATHRLYRR